MALATVPKCRELDNIRKHGGVVSVDSNGPMRAGGEMQPTGVRRYHRVQRLLPPLPTSVGPSGTRSAGEYSGGSQSPKLQSEEPKAWSRYHVDCVVRPGFPPGGCGRGQKKKLPACIPIQCTSQGIDLDNADGTEVTSYLSRNKEFLESYIMEYVSIDELERWFFRKLKRDYSDGEPINVRNRIPNPKITSITPLFSDILKRLQNQVDANSVLAELAKTITAAVNVDAYRIYKLYSPNSNYVQCFMVENDRPVDSSSSVSLERADVDQVKLVLEVAKNMTTMRVSRHEHPSKFPRTPLSLSRVPLRGEYREANHILYQPILTSASKVGYVIEMWRIEDRFKEIDEQISANFMLWGSLALHYCNLYLDKQRERNLSDFLLDVVKAIFEEMVSLDQLIKKILEFAQRLVNADRASLFLVDYRNFELVSTVFDMKFEPGLDGDLAKKEIRMPITRGIAGHVALSGETMNIPDAYSDYRFNREVDEATGYRTISILCMPVKVEGKVIGVVQMVNKRDDDNFDHKDEVSFEIFSTFFGLALHHARLYDRIMRKEQKYRVALEVLSYHNTCKDTEVEEMLTDTKVMDVNLNNFALDPYTFDEYQKCKCVITMFGELFDMSKFDLMTLTRFVLTVKKNYRAVPYHNFDHGWSVAHAMYVILKNDELGRFDNTRRLALFVSSLCHDLDHRGYTNKYMSETASPLAAMYTTSTLEHHHFNITVTILQQDGHNIFAHITSEEYKEILGYIRQAILATDLAAFFPNLAKIKDLHDAPVDSESFNWNTTSHIDLAMAISMTAADLSASAKPWKVQLKTVKVIFEEFYDQGDKERAIGKIPIPMMDRSKPEEQPASQVGFLSQICIPCYDILHKILPHTDPMYNMAALNLERWKFRAQSILNRAAKGSKDGPPDYYDDFGDDDINVDVSSGDVGLSKDNKDANKVTSYHASQDDTTISWEEESMTDAIAESVERLSAGYWKDDDDAQWIDEEGVVVKSDTLKGEIKHVKTKSSKHLD